MSKRRKRPRVIGGRTTASPITAEIRAERSRFIAAVPPAHRARVEAKYPPGKRRDRALICAGAIVLGYDTTHELVDI